MSCKVSALGSFSFYQVVENHFVLSLVIYGNN
ncbi:hypothetical protein ACMD2_03652, partial [Ananas comosus]